MTPGRRETTTSIFRVLTVAGLLLLTLAGCGTRHNTACRPGEHPVIAETLYFGSNKPGGFVTDQDWATFVTETVTPAFPAGLTTWTASGQWRGAHGALDRETSHVLQLTHEDTPAFDGAIAAITARYKQDFQQEAVLRIRTPACVTY